MKIQIALLCACVMMTSAGFIYENRYPIEQHENQFPAVNFIEHGFPFLRGGSVGRRYKRGIYDFQMNRVRSGLDNNGLGQWHQNGFSSLGGGANRYDKLRKLAATISRYW